MKGNYIMKKKLIYLLCSTLIFSTLSACSNNKVSTGSVNTKEFTSIDLSDEGKVLNIYCWHEEFKGYFETYYLGTMPISDPDNSVANFEGNTGDEVYYENAKGVPEGIEINWIVNPNDDGIYQDKLDTALLNSDSIKQDERVDMFLAEADYLYKYVDSPYTENVYNLGLSNFENTYEYTVNAATDSDGSLKGVSFQCCPSAIIYRRSIAKDIFGSDNPDIVQTYLDDWDKFDNTAKLAKEKGYYMVPSFSSTFRAFANSKSIPWVDDNHNLQIDENINKWIEQTDLYVNNGYCQTSGIWDEETTKQMFKSGKTFCYIGPAWFFQFSMNNARDDEDGTFGDWGVCKGPMPHFWGGTWLLAATGTDNPKLISDIMDTFVNDYDVCQHLIKDKNQFTNNKLANESFADDPLFGDAFLGGQNATNIYCELANNIKFDNQTIYDQLCNDGLQNRLQEYWKGDVSKEDAMNNYYLYLNEKFPSIKTPINK